MLLSHELTHYTTTSWTCPLRALRLGLGGIPLGEKNTGVRVTTLGSIPTGSALYARELAQRPEVAY